MRSACRCACSFLCGNPHPRGTPRTQRRIEGGSRRSGAGAAQTVDAPSRHWSRQTAVSDTQASTFSRVDAGPRYRAASASRVKAEGAVVLARS